LTTQIFGAFGLISTEQHRSCCVLFIAKITTQVCSASPSPPPIFTAANHSTQAVRHLSLPTRRYAFRHFRTWKKYAFRHTTT